MNSDRLGHIILLLTEKSGELKLTRLLKLLFLIDQRTVKQYGYSMTESDYRIWKMGPVLYDVYNDIKHNNAENFGEYVHVHYLNNTCSIANPKIPFDKDLFSDNEINIIDTIFLEYQACSTNNIIDELHNEESLWRIQADKNGILEDFEKGLKNTSNFLINFEKLTTSNKELNSFYLAAKENSEFFDSISTT